MKMEDIKKFLSEETDEEIEYLKKIIKHEEKEQKWLDKDPDLKGSKPWWRIMDIPVSWPLVKKLRFRNILVGEGGRKKIYYLASRDKVKKAINEYKTQEKQKARERVRQQKVKKIRKPKDLFDVIESYDDIKEFFIKVLNTEEPVHVLLVGPGHQNLTYLNMETW